MKALLTTDDLIKHMKNKGITFQLINENEARKILETDCYYFHMAAYRVLYPKNPIVSTRSKQYQKLDFGYLVELASIDNRVQSVILDMCLELEKEIKLRLINAVTNNSNDDGYSIVQLFLKEKDYNLNILRSINRHKSGKYCHDLIEKYYPYFPIWVLVELISFGDLLRITQFYESRYSIQIMPNNKFMNTIRDLRNASAHNNCLINTIANNLDKTKQPDIRIVNFIKDLNAVGSTSRQTNLRNFFAYDMVTLLFVYDSLIPNNKKKSTYIMLNNLMTKGLTDHYDYFETNSKIKGVYEFLSRIIDKLAE